jgi:hypothetical protein
VIHVSVEHVKNTTVWSQIRETTPWRCRWKQQTGTQRLQYRRLVYRGRRYIAWSIICPDMRHEKAHPWKSASVDNKKGLSLHFDIRSIIQGDSVARGPKLLSIKNNVIEIITWKFIYTYRQRCKTGPDHNRCWNWSLFTSKHTWMRFSKFWNTFPKVSTRWRLESLGV